jgi:hypothetical protein
MDKIIKIIENTFKELELEADWINGRLYIAERSPYNPNSPRPLIVDIKHNGWQTITVKVYTREQLVSSMTPPWMEREFHDFSDEEIQNYMRFKIDQYEQDSYFFEEEGYYFNILT